MGIRRKLRELERTERKLVRGGGGVGMQRARLRMGYINADGTFTDWLRNRVGRSNELYARMTEKYKTPRRRR